MYIYIFAYVCVMLKKEFIGPGLHLRPVHADHAQPPLEWTLNSVFQFSCSVVSDSLRPHESQHARPPCPSPTLCLVPMKITTEG